jgi:hypothetical protein
MRAWGIRRTVTSGVGPGQWSAAWRSTPPLREAIWTVAAGAGRRRSLAIASVAEQSPKAHCHRSYVAGIHVKYAD